MSNQCILLMRNFHHLTYSVYEDWPMSGPVMTFEEAEDIKASFESEEDNEWEFKILPLDDEMFYSGFHVMKMPIFEVDNHSKSKTYFYKDDKIFKVKGGKYLDGLNDLKKLEKKIDVYTVTYKLVSNGIITLEQAWEIINEFKGDINND